MNKKLIGALLLLTSVSLVGCNNASTPTTTSSTEVNTPSKETENEESNSSESDSAETEGDNYGNVSNYPGREYITATYDEIHTQHFNLINDMVAYFEITVDDMDAIDYLEDANDTEKLWGVEYDVYNVTDAITAMEYQTLLDDSRGMVYYKTIYTLNNNGNLSDTTVPSLEDLNILQPYEFIVGKEMSKKDRKNVENYLEDFYSGKTDLPTIELETGTPYAFHIRPTVEEIRTTIITDQSF